MEFYTLFMNKYSCEKFMFVWKQKRRKTLTRDEREMIDECSFSHTSRELITEVGSNALLSISNLASFADRKEMFAGSRSSEKAGRRMRNTTYRGESTRIG